MNDEPSGAVIEQAVRLAGRAPSLHNSQPWRWTFDGSALRLFSVADRMLPATDNSGRQMFLSCGIALGHLRAALAAAGWRAHVAYLPNPTRRDQLATVTWTPATVVTDADRERAAAIERRRTDRLPFAPPDGWDEFAIALRSIVPAEQTTLTVFPDGVRPELEHAARLTTALRRYDSPYQAELQWWTGHSGMATGVPADALLSEADRSRVAVARRMPAGTAPDTPVHTDPAEDRATILVLSTDGDSTAELVRCGETLSTVLLECTAAGYATCTVTNITEMPRSRSFVQALTGSPRRPQVLIRVGTRTGDPGPHTPTPRLPLDQILHGSQG
ncbi:Acg family FMN-binding oxidoreductase [Nocardia inohanensis]|uniref:Acg family FMN-binding oxidoreductase n=1 Tax=Nocardia inohanensis TaxID=209246 RepID=UPI000835719A|nr:NAD(P)H nitroreductase [Nocardia inohanensis]